MNSLKMLRMLINYMWLQPKKKGKNKGKHNARKGIISNANKLAMAGLGMIKSSRLLVYKVDSMFQL